MEESQSLIEQLTGSRPEYANTELARWEGRYASKFLAEFAKLQLEFPRHLLVATDYLFASASFQYAEDLTEIRLLDIESKILDRRSSMQGGFPWTDANNPWPLNEAPNGSVEYARPTLQLNLETLGAALGLELPRPSIRSGTLTGEIG